MAAPRVLLEEAARELCNQLTALITGAPAASFLAAHPPGSIYWTTDSSNPASHYGGEWRLLTTQGGFAWLRTDDGSGDDGTTQQFLTAHPVGSIYWTTNAANPSTIYGGSWTELPTDGAYAWMRTQ